MKPVLVTTKHRGVFAGLVSDDQDMNAEIFRLEEAMMCIYWSGEKGIAVLASEGPPAGSKVGAKVPVLESLRDITAVWAITDKAWEQWNSLTPKP